MRYEDMGIDFSTPSTLATAFEDPGLSWTVDNLKLLCLALSARCSDLEESASFYHQAYEEAHYSDWID